MGLSPVSPADRIWDSITHQHTACQEHECAKAPNMDFEIQHLGLNPSPAINQPVLCLYFASHITALWFTFSFFSGSNKIALRIKSGHIGKMFSTVCFYKPSTDSSGNSIVVNVITINVHYLAVSMDAPPVPTHYWNISVDSCVASRGHQTLHY